MSKIRPNALDPTLDPDRGRRRNMNKLSMRRGERGNGRELSGFHIFIHVQSVIIRTFSEHIFISLSTNQKLTSFRLYSSSPPSTSMTASPPSALLGLTLSLDRWRWSSFFCSTNDCASTKAAYTPLLAMSCW